MTCDTEWINLFATSRAVYFFARHFVCTTLSMFSCDAGYDRQRNGHPQSADQDINADGTSTSPTASGKIAQYIALSYELIKT